MTELLGPVPGYPGYQVSSSGQVTSPRGRALRHEIVKGGYHRVAVHGATGRRRYLVHVLVAELFLGPKPPGHEVNHRDGDKNNNNVANLEYVTPASNVRHSFQVLGVQRAKGSRNSQAKLTEDAVRKIRAAYRAGGTTKAALAQTFGVSPTTVGRVVSGERWKHVEEAIAC